MSYGRTYYGKPPEVIDLTIPDREEVLETILQILLRQESAGRA